VALEDRVHTGLGQHIDLSAQQAVAETIHQALTSDTTQLRWVCAWGGQELVDRRPQLTDQEWVDLGAAAPSKHDYAERYLAAFGVDIAQ